MTLPIRVGIVDDHPGVRVGIRNLLAKAEDILVIGEGKNGAEAIQLASEQKPDILLLDVELPVMRGDMVMQQLHETKQEIKVLAISGHNDPAYVCGMLENGAAGYITKEEAPNLLVEAVHSIVDDHLKWISPYIAKNVSSIVLNDISFTGRELEILRSIVLGKEAVDIMHSMKYSQTELDKCIDQLMKKMHVSSMEDLQSAAECILTTIISKCTS